MFNNPQAFNGHKGNCKQHYLAKYGNLNKFNENNKAKAKCIADNNAILGSKRHVENQTKKEIELNTWISEQHKCEKCGKIMIEKYGSGRFCCQACARSFSTSNNREEINNKIGKALKDKVVYSNGEKIIYLDKNDVVPDGFIRGNFSLIKNLTFEEFKQEVENRELKLKRIREYNKKYYNRSYTIRKIKSDEKKHKLEEFYTQLTNYNEYVLKEYENLLAEKAKGKNFYIPESNIQIYAKYKAIMNSSHKRSNAGRVFIHVLLAECLLDRDLTLDEVVHHINHDKLDNRFDNIYIFKNKGQHARFHYSKYYILSIDNDVLICDKINFSNLDKYTNILNIN